MDTLMKIMVGIVVFDFALAIALYNRKERVMRNYVLLRLGVPGPTFLVSTEAQDQWTTSVEEATTWPSEHAAQQARAWRGMDPDDVLLMEVDRDLDYADE